MIVEHNYNGDLEKHAVTGFIEKEIGVEYEIETVEFTTMGTITIFDIDNYEFKNLMKFLSENKYLRK